MVHSVWPANLAVSSRTGRSLEVRHQPLSLRSIQNLSKTQTVLREPGSKDARTSRFQVADQPQRIPEPSTNLPAHRPFADQEPSQPKNRGRDQRSRLWNRFLRERDGRHHRRVDHRGFANAMTTGSRRNQIVLVWLLSLFRSLVMDRLGAFMNKMMGGNRVMGQA